MQPTEVMTDDSSIYILNKRKNLIQLHLQRHFQFTSIVRWLDCGSPLRFALFLFVSCHVISQFLVLALT